MKMKSRTPISWKLEEYAFGAVALRDEMKRHKKEDSKRWSIFKAVGIRLLFAYAVTATLVIVIFISVQNALMSWVKKIR